MATQTASRFAGLSSAEARERARASGTNRFETAAARSYLRICIDNAFPAANVALMAVAAVLIGLGLFVDALFTGGLVLGNIVVGIIQESRAKRQLERIAVLARSRARVIRDGREQAIDPDDIVQGDIVIVGPGEQVQADGRVLADDHCSIDESLLTGESDLVRKREGDEVYSGTFCTSGQAVYRSERVGAESFANRIAATARTFRVVRTPLQREIGYVMWAMAVVVALLSTEVVVSLHSIYGRLPVAETARAAAVTVTLVPQGLWVMVTVTYAMAIVRMSRLGTLIQRQNAIESMSHVDVLCLDKTGTITTNALTLEDVHPVGVDEREFRQLLGSYCASTTSSNRTNDAIRQSIPAEPFPAVEEVHFDSIRRWSGLVVQSGGMNGVYVLGAPEVLLPHTTWHVDDERLSKWSQRGLRVLLFATRPGAYSIGYQGDEPELPDDLTPLGFVLLRDVLRDGASDTIQEFARAGITLKIISGDNPGTVAALAREAGVGDAEPVVSGRELDGSAGEIEAVAVAGTVFGRVSPAQKATIIEALQRRGHYVAMVGDGVNDVPALKRSDVAISVRSASPVARSIADIILLDDSFSSLPRAFTEGRRIRAGMAAVIRLFLSRTFALAIVILGAALLSSEFPLSPRHTAIFSTLTVGIPALFIAAWARPQFTGRYLVLESAPFVVPAAIMTGVMGLLVYEAALRVADVPAARTTLTAAGVLVGALLIPFADAAPEHWMRVRGMLHPPRMAILAAATVAFFFFAMLLEPLRRFYELEPLGVELWLIVAGGVIAWTFGLATTWRLMTPWTVRTGARERVE